MPALDVNASTLAGALWPARGAIRAAALAVIGAALITLGAKISVPFYPVPMTLQTLAVLLIGASLGWRLGVASVALYLAQGAFGLPVFTNTPPLVAGPLYLIGPTGGFLLGFMAAAAAAGSAAERGFDRSVWRMAAAMLVADAALMLCGFLWLAFGIGLGAERAYIAGVAPFLLGEAVKIALAAALVAMGRDVILRRRD